MTQSNGDVRVVGLVSGNHLIEDIARNVAYGEVTVIPGELALMSKDLWRSLSQKFLYQLPTIPTTQAMPASSDTEKVRLERYAKELESLVSRLEAENRDLKAQLQKKEQDTASKLDSILSAIQSGIQVSSGPRGNDSAQKRDDFVDGSAPAFIPSEIVPKDVAVHIDIQGESGSSVSGAAERLRKLRKGSQ